jgi:hypothetical protein
MLIIKDLPVHAFCLHISTSNDSPKQWAPVLCGYGLEHERFLFFRPVSHVTEHSPQSDQSDQPPFTLVKITIFYTVDNSIFISDIFLLLHSL